MHMQSFFQRTDAWHFQLSRRQVAPSFRSSELGGSIRRKDPLAVSIISESPTPSLLVQAFASKKVVTEQLWQQFFLDPSQWWDHRSYKFNARYPDFKHKRTHKGLWIEGWFTPEWVKAELITLKPGILEQSVFSWTIQIAECVKDGQHSKAIELFKGMLKKGVSPDKYTLVSVLKACSSSGELEEGVRVHELIIHGNYEIDLYVGSSLIDMYAKCDRINDALRVFNSMPVHNVVTWSTMISGLLKSGLTQDALVFYQRMRQEDVEPDIVTFMGVVNVCASLEELQEGRHLHSEIVRRGYESDVFLGSSLVDMYCKCWSIEDACEVFNKLPAHDVVSWSTMLAGYVKCEEAEKAIKLFQQMQIEEINPNGITFVGVLNACSNLPSLKEGRRIHVHVIQRNLESDIFVANTLVDMYAKCGSIEDACRVFNNMPARTLVSWNVMILGYGLHGLGYEAMKLFDCMGEVVEAMNESTFVGLLSACSHAGLAEEGHFYFESMAPLYGVHPNVQHYSCLVDLLGRVGHLDDAENLIKGMSCEPDVCVWTSLLGACRIHGDIGRGERVAKQVLNLDPDFSSGYVLLSNIHADAGNSNTSAYLQHLRKSRGVYKEPGCTWIEVDEQLNTFVVNDKRHPQLEEIWEKLKSLTKELEEAGYSPSRQVVLVDGQGSMEEERTSFYHSERLAIAFGLISTPPGATLHLWKNLRVCRDCHVVTKLISKIVGRRIVVRDSNRFHHFEDGICSCKDFW